MTKDDFNNLKEKESINSENCYFDSIRMLNRRETYINLRNRYITFHNYKLDNYDSFMSRAKAVLDKMS